MNLLITGSESYLGKNLIKILSQNKYNIFTCDKSFSNKKNHIRTDITSKHFIKKLPEKLDIVIHLAAISNDVDCKKNKKKCFKTNVLGTKNILKAAKIKKIKKLLFASTEWVYHDSLAKKCVNENPKLNIKYLKSEYAKTKLLSELDIIKFSKKNNIDIIIMRLGIIYGNRKKKGSAVESIFHSIKMRNIIKIGSIRTARKFIHVNDVCNGIIKSIKLKGYNLINIQGKKLISLGEIIKKSQNILKKKIKVIEFDKKNPSIRDIPSDISNKKIKFNPKFNLTKGLLTIKKNYEK